MEVTGVLVLRQIDMPREGGESREGDDEKDDNFENPERILKSKPPFQETRMHQPCKGDTGKTNTALIPSSYLHSGGVQDI